MKTTTLNNAEIVLQARDDADYAKTLQVAEKMAADSQGAIAIASADEWEHWVHLCAVWDNYQAAELKTAYQQAKKEVA